MIAGLVWWSDSWIALAISSPFFGHDGARTAADQCALEDLASSGVPFGASTCLFK